MIEPLSRLFVTRVAAETGAAQLSCALRLLVVDACGERRRLAELFTELERRTAVTVGLARLTELELVPAAAVFDHVWLCVDAASDLAYCGVVEGELAARFADACVETLAVGDVAGVKCAHRLAPEAAGAAPPWRRGREIVRGAASVASLLGAAGPAAP